jgi:hypothetical protein
MTSLRELQQSFVDGVLLGDTARIGALIRRNGIAPERRVGIYRNNAVEGFLKTMRATFPVLLRLAGENWFLQTAREYMHRFPSRCGNVHYIGEHFADFLDGHLAGSDHLYFADVARLEWAYQQVLVAADHPHFEIAALATVPPANYEALTFETHPAMRLVSSPYPILAIWKANQPDADIAPIHLDDGPSRVLIIRREDHVELRELAAGEFVLLNAFGNGDSFAKAADAALQADAAIDLGAALAHIMQLGTLVDFGIEPDRVP